MRLAHRWLFSLIFVLVLGSTAGGSLLSESRAAAATPTPTPTPAGDDVGIIPSPDGRWTAIVNNTAGSLDLRQGPDGQTTNIFPAGSTIWANTWLDSPTNAITWSPDSRTLLVVQTHWQVHQPEGTGVSSTEPIAIWQVEIKEDQPQPARQVFQSPHPAGPDLAEQIEFGQWSPNSRYVLFWLGPLGASILADGLPLSVLDLTTGKVTEVAEYALLNPHYQSWAPDSSALAVTAGFGRDAQIDKWLNLWAAASGQVTTVISQTEQIPGIVAWSPTGELIAYAAVPAAITGDLSSPRMDNLAIAGRRIYLLNPATGESRRLNDANAYQDAPLWSDDGTTLYYAQQQEKTLQLMAAVPATGQVQPVPNASIPLPEYVGYYGQADLDLLLGQRPGGPITYTPAPDGRWAAVTNTNAGSLDLWQPDGQMVNIFPAGSTVNAITWSPDSQTLLVVRTNWVFSQPEGRGINSSDAIEIWQVGFSTGQPSEPTRLYRSSTPPDDGPQQIIFGHWSPNSRYILFWEGILSASILADGLPVRVLDVTSGQVAPLAEIALANPRYQSWAPDSSAVAITAGGYRSAQVDKWLEVWDAAGGTATTVISQTEQIPGIVAWSPRGNLIAYAAVPADQSGDEWADTMTVDNPAIAGRRIYLLDPASGKSRRLNQAGSYQDAPLWSEDGSRLYYVEQVGNEVQVMSADPATGQADAVPGASQPIVTDEGFPSGGFYGQSNWDALLARR